MLGSVFVASVVEQASPQFYVATGAVAVTWALNLEVELAKLRLPVKQDLTLINSLDLFHLVLVPLLTGLRLGDTLSLIDLTGATASLVAFGVGVLQVTLALRLLTYVSLFKVLGPLLVTVLSMVSDAARFSGVLVIVIFGWANGFYSLIHSNTPSAELLALPFDYSYFNILSEMLIWLTGQATVELMAPLSPNIQFGANILFWTFLATAYFVLLNLLIAIFNSTYDRIISNSVSEWLYVRLNTLLEFENDYQNPAVQDYYEQLQARDGQRAVVNQTPDQTLS